MAIDYICINYSDTSLCLEQIEKHVGISYSRLCIIFKQETGTSINNFIIDYRIKKAKELLAAEIYKISELRKQWALRQQATSVKFSRKIPAARLWHIRGD